MKVSYLPAQLAVSDDEGSSPILVSGSEIGINVTEALISSTYTSPTFGRNGFLWGLSLAGKNESGVANLFSGTDFSPSTRALFTIGYYRSNIDYFDPQGKLVPAIRIEKLYKKIRERRGKFKLLNRGLRSIDFKEVIDFFKEKGHNDLAKDLSQAFNRGAFLLLKENVSKIRKEYKSKISEEVLNQGFLSINTVFENNQQLFDEYGEVNQEIVDLNEKLKLLKNGVYSRTRKQKYFVRGGVNSSKFKLDLENGNVNFEDRFMDTLNVLGSLEIGVTENRNQYIFGGSIKFDRVSSLFNLKKRTYTQTITDTTITPGVFKSVNEVVAYSGNFFFTNRVTISIDGFRSFPMELKQKKIVGVGVFFRRFLYGAGNGLEVFENRSVLGLTANIIDGKNGQFVGGLYIQHNDLFNETALNGFRSLSFGVTTKYAFGSDFGVLKKVKSNPDAI